MHLHVPGCSSSCLASMKLSKQAQASVVSAMLTHVCLYTAHAPSVFVYHVRFYNVSKHYNVWFFNKSHISRRKLFWASEHAACRIACSRRVWVVVTSNPPRYRYLHLWCKVSPWCLSWKGNGDDEKLIRLVATMHGRLGQLASWST